MTRLLVLAVVAALVAACGSPGGSGSSGSPSPTAPGADLGGIKGFLLGQVAALERSTDRLQGASDRYYELAKAQDFEYAALAQGQRAAVVPALEEGRAAWMEASPAYEKMEGIVAGVSELAEFDVILDAGASGEEGGDSVVPFDLELPDGRTLPKPGNLFGVTESTLWGTDPEYVAKGVAFDLADNGRQELGDALPDANVLKGGVDALDRYAGELRASAEAWEPEVGDAFTALVVMVPTMNEYFGSWKSSRFVAGEASTQRDFVAISRLRDIQEILGGLQVVYEGVEPAVRAQDAARADGIGAGLEELKAYVADVDTQERGGKRYTPEQADQLGAEAQEKATAIVGEVSQAAAQLGIEIEQ